MMKSFFKKLAFVMALAMVVSLVAPAGSAFAAEAGIAKQGEKTVVTEAELEKAGDTVDFCFLGAPSDWKSTFKWTSSNESVATVNNAGLVTAVAAGTATIKITAGADASYVHTVEVTVGELENTYTVKQLSAKKTVLTFLEDVAFTAEDVTLSKMYDGVEVSWPIQNVKVDKNTITFETYVNYEDGDQYVVRVGAEDAGTIYNTTIGEVAKVTVSLGSGKDAKGNWVYPGKAYSNGEDGEDVIVYLASTLYNAAGVDVTSYYGTEDVVYELIEEDENISLESYDGEMVIYKIGIGNAVIANYTYYDENDDEHIVKSTPLPVISEKAPAYGIAKIDEWTIANENTTSIDWSKPVHSLKANDEDSDTYKDSYIVVKFTDTNGDQYVSDSKFANPDNKLYAADDDNYNFADKGNYLTFESTNNDKLLVGYDDGSLTTYTKTKTAVVLSLRNKDSEADDEFVKNITAFSVTVDAERKVSKIELKSNSVTLVTDANVAGFEEKEVEFYVKDQYGDAWKKGDVNVSITSTVDGVRPITATYKAADGNGKFKLSGSTLAAADKSTIKFTVTETEKYNSTTLKATIKKPKYEEDNSIKITSHSLSVADLDMGIASWENWWNAYVQKVDVEYLQLSNSCPVGYREDVELITDNNTFKTLTKTTVEEGDQFLVIYDTDGNVVKAASGSGLGVSGTKGDYVLTLATPNDDDIFEYYNNGKTGEYTVKVLEVKGYDNKGIATFRTKYEESINVSNCNAAVALKKQSKITTEETDDKKIVLDAFAFTLGGNDWAITIDNILDVKVEENPGSNAKIVKKVLFKVPVATKISDNGTPTQFYYEFWLDINRAVTISE
ncbi:MAG: Ig-like domain-containing protein [Lachnospiraceae bacterium]|nr:Ig-like domain-containing protein [Lachnospiraceae bacterium]